MCLTVAEIMTKKENQHIVDILPIKPVYRVLDFLTEYVIVHAVTYIIFGTNEFEDVFDWYHNSDEEERKKERLICIALNVQSILNDKEWIIREFVDWARNRKIVVKVKRNKIIMFDLGPLNRDMFLSLKGKEYCTEENKLINFWKKIFQDVINSSMVRYQNIKPPWFGLTSDNPWMCSRLKINIPALMPTINNQTLPALHSVGELLPMEGKPVFDECQSKPKKLVEDCQPNAAAIVSSNCLPEISADERKMTHQQRDQACNDKAVELKNVATTKEKKSQMRRVGIVLPTVRQNVPKRDIRDQNAVSEVVENTQITSTVISSTKKNYLWDDFRKYCAIQLTQEGGRYDLDGIGLTMMADRNTMANGRDFVQHMMFAETENPKDFPNLKSNEMFLGKSYHFLPHAIEMDNSVTFKYVLDMQYVDEDCEYEIIIKYSPTNIDEEPRWIEITPGQDHTSLLHIDAVMINNRMFLHMKRFCIIHTILRYLGLMAKTKVVDVHVYGSFIDAAEGYIKIVIAIVGKENEHFQRAKEQFSNMKLLGCQPMQIVKGKRPVNLTVTNIGEGWTCDQPVNQEFANQVVCDAIANRTMIVTRQAATIQELFTMEATVRQQGEVPNTINIVTTVKELKSDPTVRNATLIQLDEHPTGSGEEHQITGTTHAVAATGSTIRKNSPIEELSRTPISPGVVGLVQLQRTDDDEAQEVSIETTEQITNVTFGASQALPSTRPIGVAKIEELKQGKIDLLSRSAPISTEKTSTTNSFDKKLPFSYQSFDGQFHSMNHWDRTKIPWSEYFSKCKSSDGIMSQLQIMKPSLKATSLSKSTIDNICNVLNVLEVSLKKIATMFNLSEYQKMALFTSSRPLSSVLELWKDHPNYIYMIFKKNNLNKCAKIVAEDCQTDPKILEELQSVDMVHQKRRKSIRHRNQSRKSWVRTRQQPWRRPVGSSSPNRSSASSFENYAPVSGVCPFRFRYEIEEEKLYSDRSLIYPPRMSSASSEFVERESVFNTRQNVWNRSPRSIRTRCIPENQLRSTSSFDSSPQGLANVPEMPVQVNQQPRSPRVLANSHACVDHRMPSNRSSSGLSVELDLKSTGSGGGLPAATPPFAPLPSANQPDASQPAESQLRSAQPIASSSDTVMHMLLQEMQNFRMEMREMKQKHACPRETDSDKSSTLPKYPDRCTEEPVEPTSS